MAHEAAEPAHSKPKPSAWPPIPTLAALPTVHHHISLHVPWLIMSMRADGLACNVDSDLTGITKSWLFSPQPFYIHCPAPQAEQEKERKRLGSKLLVGMPNHHHHPPAEQSGTGRRAEFVCGQDRLERLPHVSQAKDERTDWTRQTRQTDKPRMSWVSHLAGRRRRRSVTPTLFRSLFPLSLSLFLCLSSP